MSETRPKRRLAAILAADVVGYSRLIRSDEDGTLSRLRTLRTDVIDPRIARNDGRVFKVTGDGILIEFSSAVDAVHAAVDVQEAMARRNAELPEDRQIAFRVGISLGDVVIEGDDIHGDGVNMAARLEAMAEPGGICVSDSVHGEVHRRTSFVFADLGEQTVKAHDEPIRAWRWVADNPVLPAAPEDHLALPDKPSIAVLAFDNMSGDPDQDFFAEGIAEDIITALSRIDAFFVTARNSSFTYKGRAVDVQQVGRELGVRYVVEGSVRRAGNRVRITAQLIDAATGAHVWAEKYDRNLDDIFEVQDEITRNVVASMQIQIQIAEASLFEGIEEPSLPVWGLVSRAVKCFNEITADSWAEGTRLAEQAIELDPKSGRAHQSLATFLFHRPWMGFVTDRKRYYDRGREVAERAIALNPRDESAYWIAGMLRLFVGEHDSAIAAMERSIEINPNYSRGYGSLATVQNFSGMPEPAIENNHIALRSNPVDPGNFYRYAGLAVSYLLLGRLDEGLEWARKTLHAKPDWYFARAVMIVYLVRLDRMGEARAAADDFRRHCPDATIGDIEVLPFRRPQDRAILVDTLRSVMDG